MRLSLQSQKVGDVVVIRGQGRIVAGPEVEALEAEVLLQTRIPGSRLLSTRKVLLNLSGTDFIDSSGLGALVRLLGMLRAAECDLKLCDLSSFVLRVLQMTNLTGVLPTYGTEAEALEAFAKGGRSAGTQASSKFRVVCVDPSRDLLAYVGALLERQGYGVLTTKYAGEAITLVSAADPMLVVCGPGMMRSPIGAESVERIRKASPKVRILVLPDDFSTTEAGDAGAAFVAQVEAVMKG